MGIVQGDRPEGPTAAVRPEHGALNHLDDHTTCPAHTFRSTQVGNLAFAPESRLFKLVAARLFDLCRPSQPPG